VVTTESSDIATMANEISTDCAWCLSWQGIEFGEGSHGICEVHSEIQYIRYQLSRMPSAMEQNAEYQRNHSLVQW